MHVVITTACYLHQVLHLNIIFAYFLKNVFCPCQIQNLKTLVAASFFFLQRLVLAEFWSDVDRKRSLESINISQEFGSKPWRVQKVERSRSHSHFSQYKCWCRRHAAWKKDIINHKIIRIIQRQSYNILHFHPIEADDVSVERGLNSSSYKENKRLN